METRVIQIDPRELKLLKLNARYMRHEEYQRLVANIKRDGQLTSAPFACKDGDKYLVLSGNHRTQAAIAAGLKSIPALLLMMNYLKTRKQVFNFPTILWLEKTTRIYLRNYTIKF